MKKDSNTVKKLDRLKKNQFKSGFDPRRNLNGRPRSADALRKLAQEIAYELSGIKDKNTGIELTNAQVCLRNLMKKDSAKFLEIAFGKPAIEVQVGGDLTLLPGYVDLSRLSDRELKQLKALQEKALTNGDNDDIPGTAVEE